MAAYPYGQGQWPPPPSQQPQHPPSHPQFAQYDYRPPSNPPVMYNAAPYQAPPQPQPTPNYYDAVQASHAAYEHNAQVSGLGIALEPSGQRSPNAVGGDLSWSEAFPTAASASASSSVYPPYSLPNHHAHAQQQQYHHPYSSQPATSQQAPQRVVYSPPAYQAEVSASQAYNPEATIVTRESEPEEGELSEDDEDPYEPEETSGSTRNDDVITSRSPTSRDLPGVDYPHVALGAVADLPSRDASVIDTQDDAFYDEDEDEEPGEIKSKEYSQSASDAADADDEDMGYSDSEPKTVPPLSGERAGSYSPRLSPGEVEESGGVADGPLQNVDLAAATAATAVAEASASNVNGIDSAGGNTGEASRDLCVVVEEATTANKLPYNSVDDAKKEAQRAILRLIPYGVSYQTYIDEGFDEKLVKPLFTELGLKAAPTESTPVPRSASPVQATAAAAPQPEPAGNDGAPKKEERKDRIARLLALKASKPTPVPAAKPPAAAHLSKPEKTKSEKAILLQQRLEALKQAQEQRAAAATKAAAEATALDDTVSRQQSQAAAAIVETIADRAAAISAALPPTPPANSRQRPVAADFADFSTALPAQGSHNPLKRPYELTRQRSSVIIDVSDDSADEDVAMELDSQADDPGSRTAEATSRRDSGAPLYRDDSIGASNGNSYNDRRNAHTDAPFSSPRPPVYGSRAPPTAPASMLARPKEDEYTRKMREIELMKRKIAEAEAKKARGSPTGTQTPQTGGQQTPQTGGQQTPPDNSIDANSGSGSGSGSGSNSDVSALIVRPPLQPLRRITSTGELSGEDRASSPLASVEASSARLPKRSDVPSPVPSGDNHREKRMRVASLQLPRVEASLQEKMFKLRLLQDKVAALQAEIDAGVAEKRRLTEDIDDLANGSEVNSMEREVSTQPPLLPKSAQADQVLVVESELDKEAGFEAEMEGGPDAEDDVAASADADQIGPGDDDHASQNGSDKSVAESIGMSDASSPYEPASDMDDEGDIEMVDEEASVEVGEEVEEEGEEAESEEGEADDADNADAIDELFHGESQPQQKQLPRPASAAKPAVAGVKAGTLSSVYVPYESPLQYFRSYRYHPQYRAHVPSGFRSLTYSGKIQDDVALCPIEMADGTCLDASCPFQHFAAIVPKDDQILVELGRADDYTGEQKSRFVDGLTSLLKKIRDDKERDFDKIAESIIDFRRRFLGDDTRIISHLEGVTV
ncbi:hypothetical protein SBRCBS47491_000289 [Sporothrix bragantina]|uniref:Putative zinc-finger domain-containing protein n=1 Tax=Sporothrix bragantina TaxID=671064 RepID=A0ABP0AP39_9PEZI